jgi:transmembrane 9 superfamily protein 2/4
VLCKKSYRVGDAKSLERLSLLKKGMLMNYQHHWILDNMPITWCYQVSYAFLSGRDELLRVQRF